MRQPCWRSQPAPGDRGCQRAEIPARASSDPHRRRGPLSFHLHFMEGLYPHPLAGGVGHDPPAWSRRSAPTSIM